MSSDPFNFGRQPGTGPGVPPGAPTSGPFASGTPFGGPPQQNPSSPPQAGPGGVFGAPAAASGLTAAKPPVWLLFVAAGLALTAGAVALLLNEPAVAIVCWVLAGPVAIGLLALFVVKDTFARSSGLYAAPAWVKPLHYGAIVLCLVCILVPALQIADWVGHL